MDAWWYGLGGRLWLRPMTDDLQDAYTVARWYNQQAGRRRHYGQPVVTPDSHIAAMRSRVPHDLIWMVCAKDYCPVGMVSLTIAVNDYTAEYGRIFVDPKWRRQGYGTEAEFMALALGFEFFGLVRLWADVRADNEAARKLHRATGWQEVYCDPHGHPSDRGPVWHLEYVSESWPENRQRFVERFGVTL